MDNNSHITGTVVYLYTFSGDNHYITWADRAELEYSGKIQTQQSLQLSYRVVWHLIARHNSIDYRLSGSAMTLSSFEFGLRLFLLIY